MKLETKKSHAKGMTLIGALVTIALIALLAAILLPASAAAKRKSQQFGCVNCIKETSLAFEIWSGDNDNKFPTQVYATNDVMMKAIASGNSWMLWQTMSNELSTPRILHCPNDHQTTSATNFEEGFTETSISYFFNPDATNSAPQMVLDGDDNIVANNVRAAPGILRLPTDGRIRWTPERHAGIGNIGMADGSVSQVNNNGLSSMMAGSDTNSIRLVIP